MATVAEKPAGVNPAGLRHRLRRLACAATRCRLRFLTDRRRLQPPWMTRKAGRCGAIFGVPNST
jgi:hypothetical protein